MGSCTTSSKIKSGEEAFNLKKFAISIPMLQTEYSKAKDNTTRAKIAKMIAQAYDMQSNYQEAEPWYKSYREMSVDKDAAVEYAKALMRNEKYTEAKSILEQYLKVNRQDRRMIEPMIATCDYVLKDGKEDANSVKVTSFPSNSSFADFDANIFQKNIVFSSTRRDSNELSTDWNHEGFSSLWKTDLAGNHLMKYDNFGERYHVASLSMTANEKTAYFTHCGSDNLDGTDYCGIYRIQKAYGGWSAPEKISVFGDSSNTGQSYISPDGKTLFFSSDAPFGYGGKDLYMLQINADGTYGSPLNLGSRVNTQADEMFPYITNDGQTLYYSSNSDKGFGGLDIYKASRVGRLFANPERLPYGINTGRDDYALKLFNNDISDTTIVFRGLMTSNRIGSHGDDIYFVELKKTTPKKLPPPLLVFEGHAVENIYADSLNPNSQVIREEAVPQPEVKLSGVLLPADNEGYFTTQLDSGLAYSLEVGKSGYLTANIKFNTLNVKAEPGDTIYFKQKVILSKIYKNVEIVLNNIYYDFDKWDIREDAKPTLDSLSQILLSNPNIEIELASHTDCKGDDDYNVKLSQRRAQSVVDYLISKGVDGKRLTAKGYGESMPLATCACETCTEEQNQMNRRTSFKIINIKK